ncbi:phosphopantetheine-binding protein [Bacillus stercoris]|nr:phosphopantetheine-binding protein [Bacillus stercoris]
MALPVRTDQRGGGCREEGRVPDTVPTAAYLFTDETIDEKQLREYLRRHVPEYMIPSRFIVMDEMPLTANGKLDKKALPELAAETKRKVLMEAPASETEKMVLEVWKRVLGQDSINVHDKFFEIGGTSLHLIQVNQQLSKETGKSIPMVEMFRRPTVQLLAEFLSGRMKGNQKRKHHSYQKGRLLQMTVSPSSGWPGVSPALKI